MQNETSLVKRGRGRPRKNSPPPSSDVAGPANAPVKRGRGRPRKNPAQSSTTPSETANVPIERGRGRPRKHPLVASGTSAQSPVSVGAGNATNETVEEVRNDGVSTTMEAQSPAHLPAKRGRGRPRKHLGVAKAITKRGRGRPRKHPLKESTEGMNETNADNISAKGGGALQDKKVDETLGVKPVNEGPEEARKPNSDMLNIPHADPESSQKVMKNENKESPPVKRGRGRPRKHPAPRHAIEESEKRKRARPAKVQPQIATEIDASLATTVKRGRGRPRKNPAPPTSSEPAVKRKRGRPRKDQPQTAEVATGVENASAKRRRGRPKKIATVPTDAAPVTEGTTAKRGRGRPRKNPVPPSSSEPPVKRKRGRPRKDQGEIATEALGAKGIPVKPVRGRPRKQQTVSAVLVPIAPRTILGANGTPMPQFAKRTPIPIAPRVSEAVNVAVAHQFPGFGAKNTDPMSVSIPVAPCAVEAPPTQGKVIPVKRGRSRGKKQVKTAIAIAPRSNEAIPGAGVEKASFTHGVSQPTKEMTSGIQAEDTAVKRGIGPSKTQRAIAGMTVSIAPRAVESSTAVVGTSVPSVASSAIPETSRAGEASHLAVNNASAGLVVGTSDPPRTSVPITINASEVVSVAPHAADLAERKPDVERVCASLAPHEASKEQTVVTPSVGAVAERKPKTLVAPAVSASHANATVIEGIEEQTTGNDEAAAVRDMLTGTAKSVPPSSFLTEELKATVHTTEENADGNSNEGPAPAQPVLETGNEVTEMENISPSQGTPVHVNLDEEQQVNTVVNAEPGARRNVGTPVAQNAASIENGISDMQATEEGNTYESSLPACHQGDNVASRKPENAERANI